MVTPGGRKLWLRSHGAPCDAWQIITRERAGSPGRRAGPAGEGREAGRRVGSPGGQYELRCRLSAAALASRRGPV